MFNFRMEICLSVCFPPCLPQADLFPDCNNYNALGFRYFDRDDCVQIVLPLAPLCLFIPFVKLLKCGEYLNVGDLKLKCHLKAHNQRQRKAGIFSTDAPHS